MPSDTPRPHLFQDLLSLEPPRVWSMLATIFGDLARAAPGEIPGPVLTRLTDGMDIRPEAVRVALHRLRNDGWITSTKSGRTASHSLSQYGREQSRKVAPLIYSSGDDLPQTWQLALTEANDPALRNRMTAAGFVQLIPRVFFAGGAAECPDFALALDADSAPLWLRAQVVPTDLTEDCETLMAAVGKTARAMVGAQGLTPLEIAILRCLTVHHWRRLVLRHPYLPPSLTGPDWSGHACRDAVTDLLAGLPRPDISELAGT